MASSTTSSTTSSTSRWSGLADPGPGSHPFSRGGNRARGNGRGGRGGRGGGRGPGGTVREAKADSAKPDASQEKIRPSLEKVSAANAPPDLSERTPLTPRTKNASRRLSRSTPAPIATQLSIPSTELPSPAPRASSSNRRRRSQAGKGPSIPPKATPDVDLAKQDKLRPALEPIAARDVPPHLAGNPDNDRSPAEMRTNIDALVERVRAVAMAENRPTTPGSHIDWAGDDDDSLPDLHDWGIPTLMASQTISPIIVDGLKPLPEPITRPVASQFPVRPPSPLAKNAALGRAESQPEGVAKAPLAQMRRGADWKSIHPSQPAGRKAPLTIRGAASKPVRTPPANQTSPAEVKNVTPKPASPAADPEPALSTPETDVKVQTEAAIDITVTTDQALTITVPLLDAPEASAGTSPAPAKKSSLADSIHAPASARDPLFAGIGDKSGLAASIHAPQSLSDATSAPATLSTYDLPPRGPPPMRNDGGQWGHSRRAASANSHPRNQRPNNAGARGYNHSRNHSSPHTSAVDGNHRQAHARPVITGDAISRLARTIVSTAPKSASAVSTSTD